jgi:hypothetical protein
VRAIRLTRGIQTQCEATPSTLTACRIRIENAEILAFAAKYLDLK